jgi:hypothetical protein
MKKYTLLFLFTFLNLISFAQSIEEIQEQHRMALGGEKQLQSLNTLETIATMKTPFGSMPVKIYQKHLEGYKQEFEVMGNKNFILVNKEGSYNFMPIQGMKTPQQNDDKMHRFLSNMLNIQGDMAQEEGVSYKFLGHHNILEKEVLKVAVFRNDRFEKLLYFYLESMLKAREEIPMDPEGIDESIYMNSDDALLKENFMRVTYDKYQKTKEGYVMPYSIQTRMGEILVEQYVFNKELKKDLFVSPNNAVKTKR